MFSYLICLHHPSWGNDNRLRVIADTAEGAIKKAKTELVAEARSAGVRLLSQEFECVRLEREDERLVR